MKKLILLLGVILILLAWSPWLTKAHVENLIAQKFESEWSGISDGCGPIKEFKDTKRVIFGFTSSIRYGCGMVATEEELKGSWHSVYVSPFGTTHSINKNQTPTQNPTSSKTYNGSFYSFSYPTDWSIWEANSLLGLTFVYPTSKSDEVMNKTISSTDEVEVVLGDGAVDTTGIQTITLNNQTWYVKNYNGKIDGGTENGISYYKTLSPNKFVEITSGVSNKATLEMIASSFVAK